MIAVQRGSDWRVELAIRPNSFRLASSRTCAPSARLASCAAVMSRLTETAPTA